MHALNPLKIRQELISAIRGKLSQERVSRRLGFKSNPIHRWENGTNHLNWQQFVRLCEACGRDLPGVTRYILGFSGNPKDCGALIKLLSGTEKISEIVEKTGYSRFKISRWISGETIPSLDEMLELMDRLQFILIEFIEALVPVGAVPAIAQVSRLLKEQKNAFYTHPELEAILAYLALDSYQKNERHVSGLIAKDLGLSLNQEENGLELLKKFELITEENGKYQIKTLHIDTQGSFEGAKNLRRYWTARFLDYLDYAVPSTQPRSKTGYFVMDVSQKAHDEILNAYHDFCFKLRVITKQDEHPKTTVLYCAAQIVDLLQNSQNRRNADEQKLKKINKTSTSIPSKNQSQSHLKNKRAQQKRRNRDGKTSRTHSAS